MVPFTKGPHSDQASTQPSSLSIESEMERQTCVERIGGERPSAASAGHLETELFEFLDYLIQIAGPARTGAMAVLQALVDPQRQVFGGWVSFGTSQLVRYSRGDKEAVTTAMRRFEQVGLAEEIQSPCLAEHLQREWRIRCQWQHRGAWVAAAERVMAEFPLDGRKNRKRNKPCQDSSSIPANTIGDYITCGKSASSLQGTTLPTHPSSIPERREEEGKESIDSLLDRERALLADALYPRYVQSAAWAQRVVLGARDPHQIRAMLPALWSDASRNARAGKDGAGLLLHWIESGQADARAEKLSRSAVSSRPGLTQAKPDLPIRRSLHHDPAAIRVWEPLLVDVFPQVIPGESVQTWLAPLTAEAWDGEVLQLRTDSESAYLWITQQLKEEMDSIGIAIRVLPPITSHQILLGD